jgi:hypothetical protein
VGTIKLAWSPRTQRYVEATRTDALMSWKSETEEDLAPIHMMRALFGPKQYGQGEGRCPPEVASAWEGYVRSLGREPGWPVIVGPLAGAALWPMVSWLLLLPQRCRSHGAIESKQRSATGKYHPSQQWGTSAHPSGTGWTPDTDGTQAPPLLMMCAASCVPALAPCSRLNNQRVVLTPHHPLNLRLQVVRHRLV